ncbi:ribosome biogenesis GTPase Der [Limobrevibacterium gyesilva]|uniref:GTPase Der n=1 Tax=Limobrevibacterium gyesilva TaxID=2991712 RepID=A0AA41YNX8_9PROT|nr:ribosome biogenesis GTPase Der [Limobrevibacterium gyesilva]MCW3477024.1 ribosome biogenesis GTPase Der [Limobrevibacterium gyesilva]
MIPTVVIAGRPNVGKSTLFNKLAGRRHALVSDTPGVTRDRKDATAQLRGKTVRLVDTAGLEEAAPETLFGRMRASSEAAVSEADLVLFVVDGRAGITPADEHFAAWLRRQNRPVLLVVNKAEGRAGANAALEAFSLGLGTPIGVSAEHGDGLADLMGEIADRVPDNSDAEPAGERPLKLAIIGRPNAGKSTLLNRLLGEERMITGPEPGLTRDAVAVRFTDADGTEIELVDTAGLRRRARIEQPLEKMSVSASIEALKMAEVVVLAVDALDGIHDQDLQLARLVEREGRACVIALNKWDAVPDRNAARRAVSDRLQTSLAQMPGIPVVTLSALTGQGVDKLLPAIRKAHAVWNTRIATGALNRWFEDALERHQLPLVDGRRLKLRYITQPKARPPTFIVFGTRAEQTPEDYQRYLVNSLRDTFGLPGTPIRLQFRGTRNPYADE